MAPEALQHEHHHARVDGHAECRVQPVCRYPAHRKAQVRGCERQSGGLGPAYGGMRVLRQGQRSIRVLSNKLDVRKSAGFTQIVSVAGVNILLLL